MIKQIQIYTICIVVIVIVLSQFSFQDVNNVSQTSNNTESEAALSNSVLDSKYAEPIRDILNIISDTKKSLNKVKMEINKAKKFLDIEENIKELNNIMQ